MFKARKRSISIVMTVFFLLSILMPAAAFADNSQFTVTSAVKQNVAEDTANTELGWFKITVKDDVYVTGGKLYIDVDLPNDVKFSNDEETSRSISVTDSTYTFNFTGTNTVTVGKAAADDIYVDVTVKYIDDNDNLVAQYAGSLLVGTKGDGAISISVGTIPTLSTGTDKKIAKITIKENFKAVAVGEAVYLELPSGFKWEGNYGSISGKYGLESGVNVNVPVDNDKLLIIDGFGTSSPFGGEVSISDLEITVYPNAPKGDLVVKAWCSDSDLMDDTELVVANVGQAAIEVSMKDNTSSGTPYIGSSSVALESIKLKSNSAFGTSKTVVINLPEGVEWVSGAYTNSTEIDTFNDDTSVWVSLASDQKEATITPTVKVTAAAAVGDLTVTVSGAAEGTVVLGTIKARIDVSADKPDVTIGLDRAAGDITITETAKNSIASTTGSVYLDLPTGVTFASKPTVKINGDKISGSVTIDNDKAYFDLEDFSTTRIDEITISGIKLDLDSRVSVGDIVCKIYGTAVNAEDWDEAVAEVAIATVIDDSKVTATFTVGDEGVYLKNGRTLVQVNLLCDLLGLQKSWDAATKTAYFVKDGKVVAFPMGENAVYINGVKVPVDQGGEIINGYTCAPIRAIQMAFGGELEWNAPTATFTFAK